MNLHGKPPPRRRPTKAKHGPATVAVVTSDWHCGCQFGLCPPVVRLDGGGTYRQNRLQDALWQRWRVFWGQWAPGVIDGRPWIAVVNGDGIEGRHHRSTTQISQNLADHHKIAEACWKAALVLVKPAPLALIWVRGTEAHSGPAQEDEERLAEVLGAAPDPATGRHSRDLFRCMLGEGLLHCAHHIGTTQSRAYESTAHGKELQEIAADAGMWGGRVPNWIVRSHRHVHGEWRKASQYGRVTVLTTPGWQGKTPHVYRMMGGRTTNPEFGGYACIWQNGECFSLDRIWHVDPPEPEVYQ